MTLPLDQSIIELLNASRDDEETLDLPVNERTFGFHAQQSVEKLLKAVIGGHGELYKYTHDIGELSRHFLALGERLPFELAVVEELTNYAGVWRYQQPDVILPERRVELRQVVAALRAYALGRLLVLRSAVDWAEFK